MFSRPHVMFACVMLISTAAYMRAPAAGKQASAQAPTTMSAMSQSATATTRVVSAQPVNAPPRMTIDQKVEVALEILYYLESSNGKNKEDGDQNLGGPAKWAYGKLQIRQPCLDDFNRWNQTSYTLQDVKYDYELSKKICRQYLKRYATERLLGRVPTIEDMTCIWSGGPDGWSEPETEDRRREVTAMLAERGIVQ